MSLSLTENRIRRLAPDTFKVCGHDLNFHSVETFANFDKYFASNTGTTVHVGEVKTIEKWSKTYY